MTVIKHISQLFERLCRISPRTRHLLLSWIGRLLRANAGLLNKVYIKVYDCSVIVDIMYNKCLLLCSNFFNNVAYFISV